MLGATYYDDFIQEYLNFFDDQEEKSNIVDNRNDFCYDCNNEGYWIMMALRCEKCDKILIGG